MGDQKARPDAKLRQKSTTGVPALTGSAITKYAQFLNPQGLPKMLPLEQGISPVDAFDRLLLTEGFYVEQGLRTLSEQYDVRLQALAKLGKPKLILTPQEISQILGNITPLYDFHRTFFDSLLGLRLKGEIEMIEGLGRCLRYYIPYFKLYYAYIQGFKKAQDALREQNIRNPLFVEFCKLNETANGGFTLSQLLKFPITRLPQYLQYFLAVHDHIPTACAGADELRSAVTAIQAVTDSITKSQRDEAARLAVVHIQENVFPGRVNIVDPSRYCIKKGSLKRIFLPGPKGQKAKPPKVYLFILFNDCLLYGSPRNSKLPKAVMRLDSMNVNPLKDTVEYKNAFSVTSSIPENHHGEWILCAAKPDGKVSWIRELRQAIDDWEAQVQQRLLALGNEMVCCKDWEEILFKKKIKTPRTVLRPKPRPKPEVKPEAKTETRPDAKTVTATPTKQATTATKKVESTTKQHSPPPPPPDEQLDFYEAQWDYKAQIPQALTFAAGRVIIIVKKFDNGWWHGKLTHDGPVGLVPFNYLIKTAKTVPRPTPAPTATEAPASKAKPQTQTQPQPPTETICEECGDQPSAYECGECGEKMCAECDAKLHNKGGRATHKRKPLAAKAPAPPRDSWMAPPPPTDNCVQCKNRPRAFACQECKMELCTVCDNFIHRTRPGHHRSPLEKATPPGPPQEELSPKASVSSPTRPTPPTSSGPIPPTGPTPPGPTPPTGPTRAPSSGPTPPSGPSPPSGPVPPGPQPPAAFPRIPSNPTPPSGPQPPQPSPPSGPPGFSFAPKPPQPQPPPPDHEEEDDDEYSSKPPPAFNTTMFPTSASTVGGTSGFSGGSTSPTSGTIFPPTEYCQTLSTSAPWSKMGFVFYSNSDSGNQTITRPSEYESPPSSPKFGLGPAPSPPAFHPTPPPFDPSSPVAAPLPALGALLARSSKVPSPQAPPPMPPPIDDSVAPPPMGDAPEAPPLDDTVVAPPIDESVEAPPMDSDAPEAPTVDESTSSSGGLGDDFLSAIKKGGNLKKVTPVQKEVQVDSRDQLLLDIRKGAALRSVKTTSPPPVEPAKTADPRFAGGPGGLAAALEKSLNNYRKFVEDDGKDDDEEEGEFADSEWGD